MPRALLLSLLLIVSTAIQAQTTDSTSRLVRALDYCTMKIAYPHIDGKVPMFQYTEVEHKIYHAPRPWMTMTRNHSGIVWADHKSFSKLDTLMHNGKHYITKEYYDSSILLYQPYYAKAAIGVNTDMVAEELYEIAKYHPAMLLYYVRTHPHSTDGSTYGHPKYTVKIGDAYVTLTADYGTEKLHHVDILKNEEVLGDVTYTIHYRHYDTYGDNSNIHYYPRLITYTKAGGITDTIRMQFKGYENQVPQLVSKPDDYTIQPAKPKPEYKLITHKISDHIYMLECTQASSAATVVVFKDFSVVIDAPLNSTNGELVWQEVQKIAPNKPVKYYAYGHHHPWYLGGVRPFIFRGTTILTRKDNIPYIDYIAAAPHSLQPDSMSWHAPIKAITKTYDDKLVISDGEYEMVLYHIGMQSDHTEDYTMFYFPKEQLLLQDDLVYIQEGKPLTKAGTRQAGLYNAIQDLKLEVDTVLQTWPWGGDYQYKTQIPYTELAKTVNMANADKED